MPRRARMYLPGRAYHPVQRGNNREDCFFDIEDRDYYLELLSQARLLYGVALHAYVLMTNRIHLLVTPEQEDSISRMTRTAVGHQDLEAIRSAAHYCSPLGTDRFRRDIETKLGAPVGQQGRGRPRRREAQLTKK